MKRALLLIAVAAFGRAESGSFTIHMIMHAIGEEKWDLTNFVLTTTTEQSDRGNKRTTTATLKMDAKYTPLTFERGQNNTTVDSPLDYTSMHSTSFAVQTAMMRYWLANGKPKSLPAHGAATDQPIKIEPVGHDTIAVSGKKIALDRYTIANLMFGREILWMDAQHNIAAAMTFAGGLPIEAIRTEYLSALDVLYRSGVAQEMADLKDLAKIAGRQPRSGYLIVNVTLIDGTGAPPMKDAMVAVRDGRIFEAGYFPIIPPAPGLGPTWN